jgi:hypothetical protein
MKRRPLKYLYWVVSFIGDSRPTTTATRPDLSRQDTEQYLKYYQSSLADGVQSDGSSGKDVSRSSRLRRQMSGGSTSPSDYSSDDREPARVEKVDPGVRRRPSVPSDGGSDRRRLAIVQMDTVAEGTSRSSTEKSHESGSIRSRRGLASNLAGLALVAPPDAAVKSYTQLTPPSTAPITGDMTMRDTPLYNSRSETGHNRSASEAVHSKKNSPRDVGIVGTGRVSPVTSLPKETRVATVKSNVLQPPIFQQPQSRSPSPITVADASDHVNDLLSPVHARPPMNRRSTEQLIVTPDIGEGKDIGARVAAPVVVSLESTKSLQVRKPSTRKASPPTPQIVIQQVPATAFPATHTSPYLHYQPGTCMPPN